MTQDQRLLLLIVSAVVGGTFFGPAGALGAPLLIVIASILRPIFRKRREDREIIPLKKAA